MEKNLEISGIKCDNENCNYHDTTVKLEDYSSWLNKPCPECGENLLTQEDHDFAIFMDGLVNNMYFGPETEETKQMVAELEDSGISTDVMFESLKGIPFDQIEAAFKMYNSMMNDEATSEDTTEDISQ